MPGRFPKPARCCGCWPAWPTRLSLISCCCTRPRWPPPRRCTDITGSRLWQALKALDDFGLLDLDTAARARWRSRSPGCTRWSAIPAARAARAASCLAFVELAAGLLERAAAAEETGLPEDPPMWPAWQLLAPHSVHGV